MKESERISAVVLFLVSALATIQLINRTGEDDQLCVVTEKRALLSFKQSLDDPSNILSSWNETVDCCEWERVICSNLTGHVQELHLQSAAFGGKINTSLLHLKRLRYLDLSQNNFAGAQIPVIFGQLVSLEYLNLSSAGFQGVIPHNLENLSNLRALGLRGQQKANSLMWLSGLSHLEYLDLNYVNLSKVPVWLREVNKLPNLIELHLSTCSLDHITPLNHVNFSSLAVLDLSDNQFQSLVPGWIFSLSNLVSLQIQKNNFYGPVPSAQSINMAKLRVLDLSHNRFNSSLPNWLFDSKNLEVLSLSNNFLHGNIPDAVSNMSSLRNLDLSSNEFSGKIPWQIGNLRSLKTLDLSFNNLQGDLSEIFGISMSRCFLASMEDLSVRANHLSGQLTEQLGEFENIDILDLGNNSFTGPIPVNLGNLSSMTMLRIDNNKLTGNLPLSFGQLSNLQMLAMENNMLQGVVNENHFANLTKLYIISASGNPLILRVEDEWIPPFQLQSILLSSWNLGAQIPNWLRTQKSISFLDLSLTGVSGDIPGWFWNLSTSMNLSHNQLSGELPDHMNSPNWVYLSSNRFSGSLPLVSYTVLELDLSNNSFSGGLSRVLCDLSNRTNTLTILHLGRNQLSGEIPDCWTNWPSLKVINLGNNNLSGRIPDSIGLLGNLMSLNLYNNSLSGPIPSSLQNCTSLIKLDLSGNKLSGNFPDWMGIELSKLRILVLRSNMFRGEIVREICNLGFLHILDLADNQFSGSIPACLKNLTAISSKNGLVNFEGLIYYSYFMGVFMESADVTTKGSEFQYDTILSLFSSIDLSNNNLSGPFPEELAGLAGLRSLNLSENYLTGPIPNNIGDMVLLESLDISRNQLSGEIPLSITSLTFLSYLNVSHNNLSGRIPQSTQIQSFNSSSFVGNELCGRPLSRNCIVDGENPGSGTEPHDGDSKPQIDWFYVSMGSGFVVGLWWFCGTLIFKKSWRNAYFEWLHDMWIKLGNS